MEERTTTTPIVVSNLSDWLERKRITAQRLYRTDAADTEQGEGTNLDYDYVYRKLFQKTRIF